MESPGTDGDGWEGDLSDRQSGVGQGGQDGLVLPLPEGPGVGLGVAGGVGAGGKRRGGAVGGRKVGAVGGQRV